jgi:hypothetical protein
MRGLHILALMATAAAPLPAMAATVLDEDFDYGDRTVLDAKSADFANNWVVSEGSVDLIDSAGAFGSLCGGAAACVDLDGSSLNGGTFSTATVFGPGRYALSFQILGNQRRDTTDEITITLGSLSFTFTVGRNDVIAQSLAAFGSIFDDIVVGPGGSMLTFANSGGDNFGAILTSVKLEKLDDLAPVPLPAGGVLLAGGLGLLGLMRRRRSG